MTEHPSSTPSRDSDTVHELVGLRPWSVTDNTDNEGVAVLCFARSYKEAKWWRVLKLCRG